MSLTTYKWTIERYHQAMNAGLFVDEPLLDLAIVKPLGSVYRDRHPYPEDIFWLIEIANTTLNQDLTTKKDIYAEAGILEYWVVNLPEQKLLLFRNLENERYTTTKTITTNTISPLAFPDLKIPVSRLIYP